MAGCGGLQLVVNNGPQVCVCVCVCVCARVIYWSTMMVAHSHSIAMYGLPGHTFVMIYCWLQTVAGDLDAGFCVAAQSSLPAVLDIRCTRAFGALWFH